MKNNLLYNLFYKVARIPLIKPVLQKLLYFRAIIQMFMVYRRCARKYRAELEQNFDNKTILFIFAGRKDRMSIGLKYIDVLLEKKSIDEVHIWGFARNEADDAWIRGLDTKKYKLFFIQPLRKIDKFPVKLFKCVYKFYSESVFDQAIFIKMDDDIVFMDTSKFDIFLKQLKNLDTEQSLCLSANVLNNGVCDHYRQKAGLIPEEVASLEFPNEDSIKGLATHEYWEYGAKSNRLHQFFLDNVPRFLQPDVSISPTTAVPIGVRVSINFIGFSGNDCFKRYPQSHYLDDERYLTTELSQQMDRKVLIANEFMVSHLSFFSQAKCQHDATLIEGYQKLQIEFLGS